MEVLRVLPIELQSLIFEFLPKNKWILISRYNPDMINKLCKYRLTNKKTNWISIYLREFTDKEELYDCSICGEYNTRRYRKICQSCSNVYFCDRGCHAECSNSHICCKKCMKYCDNGHTICLICDRTKCHICKVVCSRCNDTNTNKFMCTYCRRWTCDNHMKVDVLHYLCVDCYSASY